MAEVVYSLCTLTAAVCTGLLLRAYLKTQVRFLLWCTLCFIGLTLNNFMTLCDLVWFPDLPLLVWRMLPGALGLMALTYGLVQDTG